MPTSLSDGWRRAVAGGDGGRAIGRAAAAKVRAFVDFLIERFAPGSDWEHPPARPAQA